jgi:hypothetical protein
VGVGVGVGRGVGVAVGAGVGVAVGAGVGVAVGAGVGAGVGVAVGAGVGVGDVVPEVTCTVTDASVTTPLVSRFVEPPPARAVAPRMWAPGCVATGIVIVVDNCPPEVVRAIGMPAPEPSQVSWIQSRLGKF